MWNRESRPAAPRRRLAAWSHPGALALVVTLTLCGASLWGTTSGAQSASLESALEKFGIRPLFGDPPPLALTGLDGQRYALESLKGRVGFLYFWATW